MTPDASLPDARSIADFLRQLRARLEVAFSPETAAPGFKPSTPSAGHCALVAMIVQQCLGGQLVSAKVGGISHWYNRLVAREGAVEIDLTGDQFGFPAIQVSLSELYPQSRARESSDLLAETLTRARKFAENAGLPDIAHRFAQEAAALQRASIHVAN